MIICKPQSETCRRAEIAEHKRVLVRMLVRNRAVIIAVQHV